MHVISYFNPQQSLEQQLPKERLQGESQSFAIHFQLGKGITLIHEYMQSNMMSMHFFISVY